MNTKVSPYLMIAILLFLIAAMVISATLIIPLTQKQSSEVSNAPIEDTLKQAGINTDKPTDEPDIITENEFKVVKDNDSERQTIIATVISKTNDDKHFTAVNNYDSSDTILIDGNYSKGDKVMITFFHDDIEKVEVLEREAL